MTAMQAAEADRDELVEMTNLSPRTTGLAMTVWVSPRGDARHDVRVKVNITYGDQMSIANTTVVGVRPTPHVIAGHLSPDDRRAVFEWLELNTVALVAHWEGRIDTIKPGQLFEADSATTTRRSVRTVTLPDSGQRVDERRDDGDRRRDPPGRLPRPLNPDSEI
jgi:hypothetical protein